MDNDNTVWYIFWYKKEWETIWLKGKYQGSQINEKWITKDTVQQETWLPFLIFCILCNPAVFWTSAPLPDVSLVSSVKEFPFCWCSIKGTNMVDVWLMMFSLSFFKFPLSPGTAVYRHCYQTDLKTYSLIYRTRLGWKQSNEIKIVFWGS